MTEQIKSAIAGLMARREREYAGSLSYPSGLWKDWLKALTFVMELSDDSLKNIRLHVGMGFFIAASWSKAYFEANELRLGLRTPEESGYIQDYLRLTKGVDEALRISELDPLREQIAIPYAGKYITEDVLRVQTTISNLRFLPRFKSCVEIGAGYGGLANQVLRAYGVEKYYVVDYPELLFYVAVWSRIVNPQRRMAIFDGRNHAEVAGAELILVPNFLQPEIEIEADLLINENSFCEMSERQVTAYLDSDRLRCRHLYSNNRDRQFMNQELPGLNAILAARFALSPQIGEYEEFYRDVPASRLWNVKYIYFGAVGGDPVPVDIRALHGLSVR